MNNTEKVGGAIRDIKVYSESELKLEINNFEMFTLRALNCIACYKSFYKIKERPMPEKEIEERIKEILDREVQAEGEIGKIFYINGRDNYISDLISQIMTLINSHYVLKSAVGEAISKLNVYKDFDDDDVVRVSEIKKAVGL